MSETTAVCPTCGHRNRVETRYLTPRYEIPCQGPWCGNVFTPSDATSDDMTVIRNLLNGRTGIAKTLGFGRRP